MDPRDTSVVSINRLRRPTIEFREESNDEAIVHPFFPSSVGEFLSASVILYDELFEDLFVWGQPIIHGLAWLVRNKPDYLQSGAAQNLAGHILNQYWKRDWGIAVVRSKYQHLVKIMDADDAISFLSNSTLASRHIRRKGWWTRPHGESPRATLVSKFLNELAYHDARENYPTWESFLEMLGRTRGAYPFIEFVQFFASSAYVYERVLADNFPRHSAFLHG